MSLLPSPPEVLLGKSDLKICSKFIEHPCRSVVTIKQLCNFIEIALQHGCSPVNLLHIFRRPFYKNTYEGLLCCVKDIIQIKSGFFHVKQGFFRPIQLRIASLSGKKDFVQLQTDVRKNVWCRRIATKFALQRALLQICHVTCFNFDSIGS